MQTFLAERGTAVDVSALHRFVHAKKRAPLLAQVQGRLAQGAVPAALATSLKAKPPAAPKAAPQKPPATAATAPAVQAAAPVKAPAPGLLPKFTWDPTHYNIEDLK
ncbi:hypothetical protein [Roseateles amylovorans]|uniref:Uncharacterized protein n=1 Tax=Roseateles amylovorans TaxID=2978473 RepID=A0ABY6AWS8_9BURK|nr:hypothetical protein [Roseateles amylovorans]UXH76854.1 hypothetical protein N4261_17690 [Roseateles amylovorans]